MRVLLDTCVWGGALKALKAAGHDVDWVGELPEDPGDDAIFDLAHVQRRVLVTLDKDFGTLVVVHDRPHAGIVRLVGISASQQGPRCAEVLERYGEELADGALVTAERHRTRIRPAK